MKVNEDLNVLLAKRVFKEKATRIFEENDANSLPTSLNDFFNKQINWYVCKYEKKTLGCFQNIKGTLCYQILNTYH